MPDMQVAVDIGGTFTDVVVMDEQGSAVRRKIPSTPTDLRQGFFVGLEAALDDFGAALLDPSAFLYATTLATNAILERRLPRIGLIVTKGFRHILETGRQPQAEEHRRLAEDAPSPPLIGLEDVQEIRERINAQGNIEIGLATTDVLPIAEGYQAKGISTVVVSLLHSYLNPAHERAILQAITTAGIQLNVVLSSAVLAEAREYERTIAACLNAALLAILKPHVESLEKQLRERTVSGRLLCMQSSGGVLNVQHVLQKPLSTVFSGPSAVAMSVASLGTAVGVSDLIAFDMGGTSTDVCMVKDGQPQFTTRGHIDGYPIKARLIDTVTIGAGGGSIARLGTDQRWHIGPDSAGAEPGPACYGRGGTAATITDAHLVLGHLPPYLLGGELGLDHERAQQALAQFGQARGLNAVETAAGIVDIANQNMCGAIRHILVRHGYAPQEYSLVALGGAGPLHGCDLARLLGLAQVIVPPTPGLAGASGLFAADISQDFSQTLAQRASLLDIDQLNAILANLERTAKIALDNEGVSRPQQRFIRTFDCHYSDLSSELSMVVPEGSVTAVSLDAVLEAFHTEHEARCGHSYRDRQEVEVTTVRVSAIGLRTKVPLLSRSIQTTRSTPRTQRSVFFSEQKAFVTCPIYDRHQLGAPINGPAVIEQYDTTIVLPTDFQARVDEWGNLVLTGQ